MSFPGRPGLGGRVPGTEGNRLAREYIREQFEALPLAPLFDGGWRQSYQTLAAGRPLEAVNVGGRLAATGPGVSGGAIVIGAHYDHLEGIAGADDNASSVAIMIENGQDPGRRKLRGARISCSWPFDAEERPYYLTSDMGSVFFYEHRPVADIEAAVLLDLCGHDFPLPGKEDALFVIGADSSPDLARDLPDLKGRGISPYFASDEYAGDKSDYYVFKKNGVPYIFLSVGWWECYHQPCDTLDKLNYEKMTGICRYLADVVRYMSDHTVRPGAADTLDLEARDLSALLDHHIPADRQEIGAIVSAFVSSHLGRS